MKNFTNDELNKLKIELSKYNSPWFSRIIISFWFNYVKKTIQYISILMILLGISYFLYNFNVIKIIMKVIFFMLSFYMSSLFLAVIFEISNIKYYQKKLNLSDDEWDYLITLFQNGENK
jgi:hypothetical protein